MKSLVALFALLASGWALAVQPQQDPAGLRQSLQQYRPGTVPVARPRQLSADELAQLRRQLAASRLPPQRHP
jgi:predicted protein tyrosine phosphatase